ncbi:Transcriptional repressor PaaX [wastewater metagenome]|uniref:Transcriptional repressor PaaX n=2 Tax=unclassified sequences TaxID=12908 RepID=A0A5B8RAM8_9ZZZZ|nr:MULTISPECIES: phenylacetic acid degradation operon negative regulatory protein PaaX [Arhodomonas]MCS4502722.1 phenylacetic acid degradation operon negative regulatory protein PaaX [Arhodomonas aquaeolei]QEA03795.1 transcriptional repressor PaaX [uncultured organism]
MARSKVIDELVAEFQERRPIRAGSLIITVYGDAIAPRGGTVWLGSLIKALAPLGLNPRLVRTSVYRLSKEGWLTSEQIGRRSYYSLTRTGWRSFERAYQRVYAEPHLAWDGSWTLVITTQIDNGQREALRKELVTLGFGTFAPGVLAHPLPPTDALTAVLQDLEVHNDVIIMHARNEGLPTSRPLNRLVRDCWNLEALAREYEVFLERFRPVWRAVRSARHLDAQQCFLVRTLLIHEIRRLLLRDPQLPDDVLPGDWHGAAARLLCRNLYRATFRQAEAYLSETLQTAEGPLPEPAPYFYRRFGGLE